MQRGFIDHAHRKAFEAGRELVRRGGVESAVCGARTKWGSACQAAPLRGHWRCLRHAGPKAAGELRNRQLRELALGRLSVEQFAKLEARRTANRLHRLWKREPWLEGATIDLGDNEWAFRAAIGPLLHRAPPAELDRARWKFRRFQVDSGNDKAWADVLRAIPDRIAALPDRSEARVMAEIYGNAVLPGREEHTISEDDWRLSLELSWLNRSNASKMERAAAFEAAKEAIQPGSDPGSWARWIEFVRCYR